MNEFKKLIGKEFNVADLNNKMMDLGCYDEYESWNEENLESGTIIYIDKEDNETQTRIEFEVIMKNGNDEIPQASYIKVIDIDR